MGKFIKTNNKMNTYTIEVKETLSRLIEVRSENSTKALEQVNEQYNNSKIVLDSNDCLDTEIYILE